VKDAIKPVGYLVYTIPKYQVGQISPTNSEVKQREPENIMRDKPEQKRKPRHRQRERRTFSGSQKRIEQSQILGTNIVRGAL
jgi:hypothetical protein